MAKENIPMAVAALQVCSGCVAATAELGARALRAAAADAADLACGAAAALRAPAAERGARVEAVLLSAHGAQRRQLHALRGAGPYWSMAVLNRLAAARAQRPR